MNMTYQLKDDGTAILTKIPQPEAAIFLPSSIDGHTITEIGSDIIPPGVKSRVREIHLPSTVTTISNKAFNDLRYLHTLTLPESLTEIKDFGIFTCPDLTRLHIPASVTRLGAYAFGYMYEHGRAYKLNYFTLLCEPNSAAQIFAEENGISYELKK